MNYEINGFINNKIRIDGESLDINTFIRYYFCNSDNSIIKNVDVLESDDTILFRVNSVWFYNNKYQEISNSFCLNKNGFDVDVLKDILAAYSEMINRNKDNNEFLIKSKIKEMEDYERVRDEQERTLLEEEYLKYQLSTSSFGLSSEYQIKPNDNNIIGVVKQYVKKLSSK